MLRSVAPVEILISTEVASSQEVTDSAAFLQSNEPEASATDTLMMDLAIRNGVQ